VIICPDVINYTVVQIGEGWAFFTDMLINIARSATERSLPVKQ